MSVIFWFKKGTRRARWTPVPCEMMSCGKERIRHSNKVIVLLSDVLCLVERRKRLWGPTARKTNAVWPYKRPQGETPTRNK